MKNLIVVLSLLFMTTNSYAHKKRSFHHHVEEYGIEASPYLSAEANMDAYRAKGKKAELSQFGGVSYNYLLQRTQTTEKFVTWVENKKVVYEDLPSYTEKGFAWELLVIIVIYFFSFLITTSGVSDEKELRSPRGPSGSVLWAGLSEASSESETVVGIITIGAIVISLLFVGLVLMFFFQVDMSFQGPATLLVIQFFIYVVSWFIYRMLKSGDRTPRGYRNTYFVCSFTAWFVIAGLFPGLKMALLAVLTGSFLGFIAWRLTVEGKNEEVLA